MTSSAGLLCPTLNYQVFQIQLGHDEFAYDGATLTEPRIIEFVYSKQAKLASVYCYDEVRLRIFTFFSVSDCSLHVVLSCTTETHERDLT